MKSSNLVYKFLVFIIFNLAIFLILSKLFFEYLSYKKDFNSFKEKFTLIKNKKEGKITNHLERAIFVFNKANYYNEINKILFPIDYNKESLIYLGTIEIKDSKKEDLLLFAKSGTTYYNCEKSDLSLFKKETNSISNSLVRGIDFEDVLLDNSINLRLRKSNGLVFFDSFLLDKREKINFYYDPELNLRLFYDDSFSKYYVIELLKNLKKLEKGIINNPKIRKFDDKIAIRLNEDLYYCINYEFDEKIRIDNFILYYLVLYKINDENKKKLEKYVLNSLNNKDFEIQNNKFLIKIKDKEIYEEITKYFFIPILIGNKKVLDLINELNICKRKGFNYCTFKEKYYELRDFPYLGKFSYLKNYFTIDLIYNLSKEYEYNELINNILDIVLLSNFLKSKEYLCLFDLEKKEEFCFKEINTKELKKLVERFKEEKSKDAFLDLLKEIKKKKNEILKSNKDISEIIKKNKYLIKNDLKGVYYFIELSDIENYLKNKIFIYPSQEIYYYPSFILRLDKIIKKDNKWIIEFK